MMFRVRNNPAAAAGHPGPAGPLARSTMLKRIFRPRDGALVPTVDGRPPRLPAGVRLYAIGDIHGRLDLLVALERLIAEDAAAAARSLFVVYLGDYVDRGIESRGVVEHLLTAPLPGFTPVYLLGNHEAWLREFLGDPAIGAVWLRGGGDATLASYGVRLDLRQPEAVRLRDAHHRLRESLPEPHLAFFDRLEPAFGFGDFFFCHAGIRPGVPLERQSEQDLMMIREPFLSWNGDAGKVIVHGHTVQDRPALRSNRIGIDTGAFWTDELTCLVVDEGELRFLSTGGAEAGG